MLLQIGGTFTRLFFLGSTGLTPTVTISKAGGAFGSPTNAPSELSDGWYSLNLVAGDLNTEGQLSYHFSAGTPADFEDQVVQQALTQNMTANVIQWAAGGVASLDGALVQVNVQTVDANAITSAAITNGFCQKIFEAAAIAEDYAADGASATPAQLLYMLWSMLSEFAIAGTTITCKKLDGTTTSMTFTLNSATTPTSRTRAT